MSSLSSLSPDPKSARKRLLVVQPLVGIGDMVWHKPWIDHLAGGFDVILAAKPTAHAKTLFHGTDGIVGWLDIDRSMRGRRGRHERPYRKLGRYAQANGFGLDRPHWHLSLIHI